MTKSVTESGRNAPCPCGSGKKHKKCCGSTASRSANDGLRWSASAAESPEFAGGRFGTDTGPLPFRHPFTEEDRDSALNRLARYSTRSRFDADRHLALQLLFRGHLDCLEPRQVKRVLSNDFVQLNLHNFVTLDLDIDGGRTILDMFLAERAHTLSVGERSYLEQLAPTHLGLYQVKEVVLDEGLRVHDLWNDRECWITERLATQALVRWDVFAARLMGRPDGRRVLEGDLYFFPVMAKERVLDALREGLDPGAPDAAVLMKRSAAVLLGPVWLETTLAPSPPRVVTTEGDALEFGEARYAVRDQRIAAQALQDCDALEPEDEHRWVWVEPDGELQRTLGTFILEGQELRIETFSRKRMKRARDLLKATVGDAVRHRATRYHRPDLSAPPPPVSESTGHEERIPPEVEAELTTTFLDQHYGQWPDLPVPALDNHTPRHAASLPTHRARVVELLRQFENQEARRALETGRAPYDFTWLWQELAIENERS